MQFSVKTRTAFFLVGIVLSLCWGIQSTYFKSHQQIIIKLCYVKNNKEKITDFFIFFFSYLSEKNNYFKNEKRRK